MSTHTRLALTGATIATALSVLVGGIVWYYFDPAHAVSLLYGAGVGVVGFASIAITVSLLTVRPTGLRVLFGFASYGARLVFVVAAVGVGVYLDVWPALPMVCGLAGVYVVENLLLLKMAPKTVRVASSTRPVGGGVERRTEV